MVSMLSRTLAGPIRELCFDPHKIALISGPRQCGKTTLAKQLLAERGAGGYHNWDDTGFRRTWAKNPRAVWPADAGEPTPLLVLDEIHKARGWKRTLKGLWDTQRAPADVLVTGSARLNVYKKGGDSLLGRALHFRMHPLSLAELRGMELPTEPGERLDALLARAHRPDRRGRELFEGLLRFGGFPEPFVAASDRRARVWQRSRVEKVIREDLRDLSRLPELSRVEMLAALLPERVGSLFSRASLREDLEVPHDTVTRWVLALEELYYLFAIRPWTKAVVRTLKKEGKLYLWDWTEVPEAGARFENLVAVHLHKACDAWTDSGEGTFSLHTLRNKEREEIDFLIARDRRPWLAVEAKLSDTSPPRHWDKFLRYLGCGHGLQLVATPGIFRSHELAHGRVLVVSAEEALSYFV